MISVKRSSHNPVLIPERDNSWEKTAAFNGSVIRDGELTRMVYRAMSSHQIHHGHPMLLSTIGIADSADGVHFHNRRRFIKPEKEWEKFGCEDPRITKLGDTYYILYTGLSGYPPGPDHIKIAVAISSDLETIDEKYPVTTFNAKAGALFPEKINGKYTMALTVHTDRPPAAIALAQFDRIEQLWSKEYWDLWYQSYQKHVIDLQRSDTDQVELGAVPLKTDQGWLLIHAYIGNYKTPPMTFGIEAALLDLEDPQKVIGRTRHPMLVPREYYEMYGEVPNVIFPSGGLIENGELHLYYGAADTTVCLATTNVSELLESMTKKQKAQEPVRFKRFDNNPIISPNPNNEWEARNTFNPTAIYLDNKFHILYRAMNETGVSVVGYAASRDGLHIDERLNKPIYTPREPFETSDSPGFSGCEDARITQIDDTLYMTYTAFDGRNPPRVALSTISVENFISRNWAWSKPKLISPPGMMDKNCCFLPEKISGKYIIFHRLENHIWVDASATLNFGENRWLEGSGVLKPRPNSWDSLKIGIASTPIKSRAGWVLFYHGLSQTDGQYRVGAALLDFQDIDNVLARLSDPVLEPETNYECSGERPGTVFPCGAILKDGLIYMYYGGADTFTAVATLDFNHLVDELSQRV